VVWLASKIMSAGGNIEASKMFWYYQQ